jgi:archaellum component FlaF (FlaF/FlaG flagellin family)
MNSNWSRISYPPRSPFSFSGSIAIAAAAALALCACGDKARTQSQNGAAIIGSAGGTVTLTGGPTLTIPAGALAQDTTITIQASTKATPGGALGAYYEFGPAGTTFTTPATVAFPVPAGTDRAWIMWSRPGSATDYDRLSTDVSGSSATAQVTHFSDAVVIVYEATFPQYPQQQYQLFYDISGKVIGAGAGVAVKAVDYFGSHLAVTDVDGAYTFRGMYCCGVDATITLHKIWVTPVSAAFTFSPTTAFTYVPSVTSSGKWDDATMPDFVAVGVSHGISGAVTGDVKVGVTVTLTGGSSPAVATTDTAGSYAFTGLADGTYVVTPSLDGYTFNPASASVVVNGNDVAGQDFIAKANVAPTYHISGTVYGVGPGATVHLTGAAQGSTAADEYGHYSFQNLADGTYVLAASMAGYTFTPDPLTVVLRGGDRGGEDFVGAPIENGHRISGKVSGAVSAGVPVDLAGTPPQSRKTDAQGAYVFENVVDGAYMVTPLLDGYTFDPKWAWVTVSGADAAVDDFIAYAEHGISGTVRDEMGNGTAGVTVTLEGLQQATTDASGHYSFSGLASGIFTVTPSVGSGYTFNPTSVSVFLYNRDVQLADFSARVNIECTRRISGKVTGAGSSAVTLTLNGGATAQTDESGSYVFADLADGTYTVTPSLGGYGFTPAGVTVTVNGADANAPVLTAAADATWSSVASDTTETLYAVAGYGEPDDVWAVGAEGTIVHWDGSAWKQVPSSTRSWLSGVWASGPDDAWAVGAFGTVLHWNGVRWTTSTRTAGWLDGVCGWGTNSDAEDIWAVGTGGALLHGDATGWTTEESGTTSDLYALWVDDVTPTLLVGAGGTIVRFGTGVEESGTARDLFAIAAPDRGDWGEWVVGAGGTIRHCCGWSPDASGTARDLYGIYGEGNQVWAVGAGGTILHGSASWQQVPDPWGGYTYAVVTDWSSQPSGTTRNLYGAWSNFVVGEGGTILTR